MTDTYHPYKELPVQAFWKPAIAETEMQRIDLAWQPKFTLSRTSRIITIGSCFAQHISAALKQNGFEWLDAEPAPKDLPSTEHAAQGYGVFSFRTGNIYTPALFRQWVEWALGHTQPGKEVFRDEKTGRYFDPFRPAIPEDGYPSEKALHAARKKTLTHIATALKEADVLIFTLGLTEAWKNTADEVYPMCPGTVRGTFSAEQHRFHNYSYQEIIQDLTATFDALRKLNPELNFLLTVSPVPLTATATNQHVLTATTYSKSVLRAAAGWLAKTREDVDYFPSYELIATPPFKAAFFADNLRAVLPEGVAFVMRQFFKSVDPAMVRAPQATTTIPQLESATAPPKEKSTGVKDICEEIILDTWSNRPKDTSTEPPNILLIGDSQMGMIARALDEMGIRYAGGAIMHGSEWHSQKFVLLDEIPYLLPTLREARVKWDDVCDQTILKIPEHERGNLWIITNVGFHSNALFSVDNGIGGYLQRKYGSEVSVGKRVSMTAGDWVDYLSLNREAHLSFVYRLHNAGFKPIWLTDPPIDNANVCIALEQALGSHLSALGCRVFPVGQWISEKYEAFPKEFLSDEIEPKLGTLDRIHGSQEYYRQLVKELLHRFSIPVQYRDA